MIYKIIGDFDTIDFEKMLTKISQKFLCLYMSDILYVALKDFKDTQEAETLIKQSLKPSKNFFIEEITQKNIQKQTEAVQQWAVDNLARLKTQRAESEQQDTLQSLWTALDNAEVELQRQLDEKNKKGGNN